MVRIAEKVITERQIRFLQYCKDKGCGLREGVMLSRRSVMQDLGLTSGEARTLMQRSVEDGFLTMTANFRHDGGQEANSVHLTPRGKKIASQ